MKSGADWPERKANYGRRFLISSLISQDLLFNNKFDNVASSASLTRSAKSQN